MSIHPTPFNLSALEWLESAIIKLKEILDVDETTDILDIYDDLQNAKFLLAGNTR
jgi:hypothetical protein